MQKLNPIHTYLREPVYGTNIHNYSQRPNLSQPKRIAEASPEKLAAAKARRAKKNAARARQVELADFMNPISARGRRTKATLTTNEEN